jgi:hypothetical protein
MPEIPVSSLAARTQTLAENARQALERGNLDYAIGACAEVLRAEPGCLAVRRLQYRALRRRFASRRNFAIRALRGFLAGPSGWRRFRQTPAHALAWSEAQLLVDPSSVRAWKRLAGAARELDLSETAVFAREIIRELRPGDRANLCELGEAWLAADRPDRALEVAHLLTKRYPSRADGPALLRKASVAQTIAEGGWETTVSFRDRLNRQAETASPERVPPARIVTLDVRTPAQIREALERAGLGLRHSGPDTSDSAAGGR